MTSQSQWHYVFTCVCVCVHVRMYVLRAAGGGRQFTGCGGRTAASALDGGHRASGRRVTHDWRRWVDGGLQARQAVNCENIAFRRSKVRGPLFFHTWTVVDRKSRVRGPLFFDTWTVVDRHFLKNLKF